MNFKPYLDYYKKYNISPVINEVDWNLYFSQRRALYNRLGIIPGCVRGRKVLEFGPGNGANVLYTMSMFPDNYVLVDANPIGIENCKRNLDKFYPNKNWVVIDSLIEEYQAEEKFDIVICECLLPQQINPSEMARHCASFLVSGGIFVATCHDMVSTVSETLRSLPGWLLAKESPEFSERVEMLTVFYKAHLLHLKGMTRTYEDWVIDNILHKEYWQDSPLFSIAEAVEALDEDFIVHATSPGFLQDWSWYKSVGDVKTHFNTLMKASYWKNVHNFIDWRIISSPGNEGDNLVLHDLCGAIRDRVRVAAEDDATIEALVEDCYKLSRALPEEFGITKVALEAYIDGIQIYLKTGEIRPEGFQDFGVWWGRGMQYVSFVKE